MKRRLAIAVAALALVAAPYGAGALQISAAASNNNTVATGNTTVEKKDDTTVGKKDDIVASGNNTVEKKDDTAAKPEENLAQKAYKKLESNFALGIATAKPGSTVAIGKEAGINTLSANMVKALIENPTISLHMEYTYGGADYSITIPAGEFELEEGIWWYGPLWLNAYYAD